MRVREFQSQSFKASLFAFLVFLNYKFTDIQMTAEVDPEFCLKDVKDMVNLSLRLLSDGKLKLQ